MHPVMVITARVKLIHLTGCICRLFWLLRRGLLVNNLSVLLLMLFVRIGCRAVFDSGWRRVFNEKIVWLPACVLSCMASELLMVISCADLDTCFRVLVIATKTQLCYELGVCDQALHTFVLLGLLSRINCVTLCRKMF